MVVTTRSRQSESRADLPAEDYLESDNDNSSDSDNSVVTTP